MAKKMALVIYGQGVSLQKSVEERHFAWSRWSWRLQSARSQELLQKQKAEQRGGEEDSDLQLV